jgi:hypothetical protein
MRQLPFILTQKNAEYIFLQMIGERDRRKALLLSCSEKENTD